MSKKTPSAQDDHPKADKSTNGITIGVQKMSVSETNVKSKNLNVLSEHQKSKHKDTASFVVIGMYGYHHIRRIKIYNHRPR